MKLMLGVRGRRMSNKGLAAALLAMALLGTAVAEEALHDPYENFNRTMF